MEAPMFKLLLLSLLPYVSSAGNLSQGCWEDVAAFLSDLNAPKPKAYAVRMYDSVGKLGSNILSGNTDRLGCYSECISAEAPSGRFRGQYCKLQVQQDSTDFYSGVCVPSSCSDEDVTELAILDTFKFKTVSFLPPVPSPFTLNSTLSYVSVARCAKGLFPLDVFVAVCLYLGLVSPLFFLAKESFSRLANKASQGCLLGSKRDQSPESPMDYFRTHQSDDDLAEFRFCIMKI